MKLTIDKKEINTKPGKTILEVAEENDIFIPHLCSHPDLSPYGGCRLCIVEVAGIKGYPTACTLLVKEGMKVRSHSNILQKMRQGILQMILSEHPSSCLICQEADDCSSYQQTIRKVMNTTGCRWCSNDGDCQLQRVVEYLKISEIIFPVFYRGIPVETDDPFFDRDYNLCIFCGRCVRICEEHRKSFVITLNQRGQYIRIAPPFNSSHLEAGCEFCGACVSVCPTGALSEKYRKWAGKPETYQSNICPVCGLNCQIQVLTKDGQIISTLPMGNPLESGGELCVRGRFCLAEMVNHPRRIREPRFRFSEGYGIVSWPQAFQKAAEIIKRVKRNKSAVYLSGDLSLEEMLAAREFALRVLDTSLISSSVLDDKLIKYISLAKKSVSLEELSDSDCLVSVFLNGNYNYSPLTLAIKRRAEKGIPYFRINWLADTTSRFESENLVPPAGKEKSFFQRILKSLQKKSPGPAEMKNMITAIRESSKPLFILSPGLADLTDGKEILTSLEEIIKISAGQVFAPVSQGNMAGLLSLVSLKSHQEIDRLIKQGQINLLYLIADSPFDSRPDVDQVIWQNSFIRQEEGLADLILPTASWGEISGSYADFKGKKRKFTAAVKPPAGTLNHREIYAGIAKKLAVKDFKFSRKEISVLMPEKLKPKLPSWPESKSRSGSKVPDTTYPYLLIQERSPNIYRHMSLSQLISDMSSLWPEDTIILNPADAAKIGLTEGDLLEVKSAKKSRQFSWQQRKFVSSGFVFLITSASQLHFELNPVPVHLRRKNV